MAKRQTFMELFLDWTKDGKSPMLYWEAAALSTLAACADRTIWYDNGDDLIYPNLFVVLVGPPGTAKSTTIKKAKGLLKKLDNIPIAPEEMSRQQMYIEMESAGRRKYLDDEGESIEYTSYNVLSTEWDTFIGVKDLEFLKILIKFWDCEPVFEYKTKHQGKNFLPRIFYNMIGDIQPEILVDVLPPSSVGTGFTSRILFIVAHQPRDTGGRSARPHFDNNTKNKLITIAKDINKTIGEMKMNKEADEFYQKWYNNPDGYSKRLEGNSRFAAYVSRKPQHAIKLSMLYSLGRTYGESMTIELQDFLAALDFLDRAEQTMADAFLAFGQSAYAKVTYNIETYIRKVKATSVADLLAHFWTDVSWTEMDRILKTLEVQNKIEIGSEDQTKWVRWLQ